MHFSWVILNPSIHQYSSLPLGPSLTFSLSRRNSRLFHITFYFLCTTVFLVWNYTEHKEFINVCVLCDFLKPLKPNISRGIGKYVSAAPLMLFFSTNQSVAFPKCHHFYFQLRRDIPPTAMAISSAIQSFHLYGAWKRGTTCCISLKQLFISNDLHLENSLQC